MSRASNNGKLWLVFQRDEDLGSFQTFQIQRRSPSEGDYKKVVLQSQRIAQFCILSDFCHPATCLIVVHSYFQTA